MPPQISDEEASDYGSIEDAPEPVSVKQEKQGKAKPKDDSDVKGEIKEEEKLMVESANGEEEDDDDDVGEDEFVVEKITNHLVDDDGILKFEVKWEGYEKKSDRTWEPEENLETASKILNEYLASIGGREEVLAQWEVLKAEEANKKTKKRGRSDTDTGTPSNGTKKGRKSKGHPADSTPPTSAKRAEFFPPSGNWEEKVEGIDACEGTDGKPIVYITWKTGQKSQHPLSQVYKRCPQKMLQFYERHLVFKRNDPEN